MELLNIEFVNFGLHFEWFYISFMCVYAYTVGMCIHSTCVRFIHPVRVCVCVCAGVYLQCVCITLTNGDRLTDTNMR